MTQSEVNDKARNLGASMRLYEARGDDRGALDIAERFDEWRATLTVKQAVVADSAWVAARWAR